MNAHFAKELFLVLFLGVAIDAAKCIALTVLPSLKRER